MKTSKIKTLIPGLLACSLSMSLFANKSLAENSTPVPVRDGLPIFESNSTQPPSTQIRLSRINVLAGGFAEIDLEILELKVMPYVEFRFNRRK